MSQKALSGFGWNQETHFGTFGEGAVIEVVALVVALIIALDSIEVKAP